jgi:acyl-CoA synthetase (NDP forming)/GNAT superfamily N-acetyltransferase
MNEPPNYPEHWETDIVANDGGTLFLRPIKPSDAEDIRKLHGRLSEESVYFRFFTPLPTLSDAMLHRFVNVDYVDRMALVAILGDLIVAVARYDRLPGSSEAEVAFLVDDAHQGRGLATIMLEYLVVVAKESGITRFVADTLPENTKMLKVFHDAGFKDHRHFQDGVVRVSFEISPTQESIEAMQQRERVSVSRSVAKLLSPKSVAVVGASRMPGSVGNIVFRNVLDSNFQGTVYPVNPKATSVNGVKAYPTLKEIPDPIDLAVLVVAAEHIEAAIYDAAEKHVGALVIISAGFSELNEEGARLEQRLVRLARKNGMRIVGPASMGVASMNESVSLNATLSPIPPIPGTAALHSQSGALSLAILEEARRRGLGISSFVSSGNKADISGNDLLHFWEDDPSTGVILLYIEDFGNPRTFARVAKRVSHKKPILAVKSKRNSSSSRFIPSRSTKPWTPQLPNDLAVDALFERTGVIRVDTLEQLFEHAVALANQPLPKGRNVAIISNTGGPAPLCADTCLAVGLEVPNLSDELSQTLRRRLPKDCHISNPIELSASTLPSDFGMVLDQVLKDPGIDAAIVLYVPTVVGTPDSPSTLARPLVEGRLRGAPEIAQDFAAAVATEIALAARQDWTSEPKPVLANFLALPGVPTALRGAKRPIPSYAFPEAAAMALGKMADYFTWTQRPQGEPFTVYEPQFKDARELVLKVLGSKERTEDIVFMDLPADTVVDILSKFHITAVSASKVRILDPDLLRIQIEIFHDLQFGVFIDLHPESDLIELSDQRSLRYMPQTSYEVHDVVTSMPSYQALLQRRGYLQEDFTAVEETVKWLSVMMENIFEISHLTLTAEIRRGGAYNVLSGPVTLATWSPEAYFVTRALRRP